MIGKDERILEAHAHAVTSALREFEAFAATRIRKNGAQNDRLTGNFAAAQFTHDTSRALDPHLHTHCIVFNATFDPVENRWKALQNYELLRARKFAENVYYHELARELKSFGYRIQNRARGDFEIEGVSEELCDRFSKRDNQVDEALKNCWRKNRSWPAGTSRTCANNWRPRNGPENKKIWAGMNCKRCGKLQLTKSERESLHQLQKTPEKAAKNDKIIGVAEAVQWAEEHLFDRNSIVLECQLWQEALGRARGENFTDIRTDGLHPAAWLCPGQSASQSGDVARSFDARMGDC